LGSRTSNQDHVRRCSLSVEGAPADDEDLGLSHGAPRCARFFSSAMMLLRIRRVLWLRKATPLSLSKASQCLVLDPFIGILPGGHGFAYPADDPWGTIDAIRTGIHSVNPVVVRHKVHCFRKSIGDNHPDFRRKRIHMAAVAFHVKDLHDFSSGIVRVADVRMTPRLASMRADLDQF
jgi:hypothetical protein